MLYLKEARRRVCIRRVSAREDDCRWVQLAHNYAALDVRRLTGEMPPCFLLAHAIIEADRTLLLEWCTWPTLRQYAGAHATLGRTINAQIIQLATWEMLRAVHFLQQALGGPHCNVTMDTVLINASDATQLQIKLTALDEAGALTTPEQWKRGALPYRPPEKLFGDADTYEGMEDEGHDHFSIGICVATLALAGHVLDEDIPLLNRGERYNPACELHGPTVLDMLREDHAPIRPPTRETRTPEFEHFVRLAAWMQALGNGIVPGGGDDPALCYAVWPEFAQLPETMAFISMVKAQRYGGSREARVICDALHRDPPRMGVIRTLMQWLPRKRRRRDLDAALRRWGFRPTAIQWPSIPFVATSQTTIDRFPSIASFYAEFTESGACSICGHMAQFRCQRCSSDGGGRLYCSQECSSRDAEHRALCQ